MTTNQNVDQPATPPPLRQPRYDLLLQLADFLEKLSPERFDYGVWVGETWKGDPDLSCGTTACAAGWACVIFPELKLYRDGKVSRAVRLHRVVDGKDHYDQFDSVTAAVRRLLLLDHKTAHWLFLPLASPPDVVKVASAIMARGRPEAVARPSPAVTADAKEVAGHIRHVAEVLRLVGYSIDKYSNGT